MARGKKGGPSRMDLRRQADAAEARDKDDDEVEEEEESDEEASEEGGDDEEAPKPKKKKAAPKPKKPAAPKRTRVKEAPRMKAIWVVFDNGGKRVKEFAYPNKADAEAFLAEKIEEKKTTFYLQMIKDQMET